MEVDIFVGCHKIAVNVRIIPLPLHVSHDLFLSLLQMVRFGCKLSGAQALHGRSLHLFLYLLSFDSAVCMTSIRWQKEACGFLQIISCWGTPVVFTQKLTVQLTRRSAWEESACAVLKSVNSSQLTWCAAEKSACRMWRIVPLLLFFRR